MIAENGHWSSYDVLFIMYFDKIIQIYRYSLTKYDFGDIINYVIL